MPECGSARRDDSNFPLLEQQGGLTDHWYPIEFSKSIKPNQTLRQVVMGVPVLVWRTNAGQLRSFVDICPHRQAQLSQGKIIDDQLSCPYHGWQFNQAGQCSHIPVAPPSQIPREPISLTSLSVCEHGGMIWVWMGFHTPPKAVPAELFDHDAKHGWRLTRAKRVFPFDLDDVIENFMDFAHTPVVHPGIIRGMSDAQDRSVTIETDQRSVRAVHEPVAERVGFLSGLFIPKGQLVQHSDTFSCPGNVKVDYWFGDGSPKFFVFLGMTPIAENQTLVLLTLGVRFGWLNPLMSLAIPTLVRKVLDQDRHILSEQRANLDLVPHPIRRSLKTDSIDSIVRAMRQHIRDPNRPQPPIGTREMRIRL